VFIAQTVFLSQRGQTDKQAQTDIHATDHPTASVGNYGIALSSINNATNIGVMQLTQSND